MQPKDEIEKQYEIPDPWEYQKTPDDLNRKRILTMTVKIFGPYERLLDIGAGEGWITQDYPVPVLHGYELSNNASKRFPSNVKRIDIPDGSYDIVTCTGIFYPHYDWLGFMDIIYEHASKHVLVSSIKAWEHPCVDRIGNCIHEEEYKYREYVQRMRLFQVKR